jgi:hypothetical protein
MKIIIEKLNRHHPKGWLIKRVPNHQTAHEAGSQTHIDDDTGHHEPY